MYSIYPIFYGNFNRISELFYYKNRNITVAVTIFDNEQSAFINALG